MEDGELLNYMGDDAAKWAAEFCKIARDKGLDIDEGWMLGWFANAIEHSNLVRMKRLGAQDAAFRAASMAQDRLKVPGDPDGIDTFATDQSPETGSEGRS